MEVATGDYSQFIKSVTNHALPLGVNPTPTPTQTYSE